MSKKWIKYYLLIGTLIMLVLAFAGNYFFIQENINQAEQKRTFESIYIDTSIDFIVPSPSAQQVQDLNSSSETGIEMFTPYYETSSGLTVNGSTTDKGTIIIIPNADKLSYTPYTTSRMIDGANTNGSGDAIVDKTYATANNCGIGDTATISIADNSYDFTIKSVSEDNTFYKDGTIALIFSETQNEQLINNGISYSGAYVKAADYAKCLNYLTTEYKPYGRLKDSSVFSDDATYQQHLDNFNNANWAQEITILKENYNTLKVKYDNVESGINQNNVINAIIVAVTIFVLNIAFLSNKSIKQFMRNYLIKQNGTKSEIRRFYTKGILFNFVIFAICSCALLYYSIYSSVLSLQSTLTNIIFPIGAACVISILMLIITNNVINANYSIKKERDPNDAKQTETEHKVGQSK